MLNLVPMFARDALYNIQVGFPDAIIGGGFLRDLDNDVKPKDVDIFVPERQDRRTFEVLTRALYQYQGRDVTTGSEYAKGDTAVIHGVYEFTHHLVPYPLNIISCAQPSAAGFMQDQLDRFDIGLCRISFDGRKLERTSPYCLDKANRTLTIVNPWSVSHSIERARRIAERYPGWRIVDKDGHEVSRTDDDFEF